MDETLQILSAVDRFPQDDAVLARALELARAHQAKLTVAHVVDLPAAWMPGSADWDSVRAEADLAARERIEAAVAKLGPDSTDIDIRIETGSPASRLIELADETGSDLIVMRAHQSDSIVDRLIGSTTDRVIRAAAVPVLVVKRPVERAYRRVVVATDLSDELAATVSRMARFLPQAALRLAHVVQIPPQLKEAMLRAGSGRESIASHRDALLRQAKDTLRDCVGGLRDRTSLLSTRVISGAPGKVLIRLARDPRVDMITVGPGSAGLLRRTLLGSVTRRVLRDADCDVLVDRAAAPADRE